MPEFEKMNPEVKDRWINGLRSGRFNQGQGDLRFDRRGVIHHCCLGVLLEVEGFSAEEIRLHGYKELRTYLRNYSLEEISQRNDGSGQWYPKTSLTFPEIADWIEENL